MTWLYMGTEGRGCIRGQRDMVLTCFVGHILCPHVLGVLADAECQGWTDHTTMGVRKRKEKTLNQISMNRIT